MRLTESTVRGTVDNEREAAMLYILMAPSAIAIILAGTIEMIAALWPETNL